MNHCSIAYTFYPDDFRVRRYSEAVAGKGNRVDVIALRAEGEKRHGRFNGVSIDRVQKRDLNEKGLHSFIIRNILFFVKASVVLIVKHIRHRYNIIHVHNPPDLLVFAVLIPKLFGAKIIFDMHENLPELYCTKFGKTPDSRLTKLLLFFEKISTNFADKIIVVHDLLRNRIISRDKIASENCTALLNYPKMAFFQKSPPNRNKEELRIIYPGTISHLHGLDIAVRALAIVKEQLPTVRLDIYGRPRDLKYYKSLRSLVAELDLDENVRIFDMVPYEDVGELISKASIGVAPKRAGIFASEALSTKILDFMAAGIPVIASRTRIDEHYFDDSMMMFFEPENHKDLAGCILDLYKNPEKGKALATNAKRFIAENNWERKKKVYHRIIEELSTN